MRDMKEALGNARKPDITHVRKALKYHIARACEYGSDKYERANFMRDSGGTAKEQVEALRVYARAAMGHLDDFLESLEMHESTDPNFEDIDGLCLAMYAEDTDAKPGCKVGASHLPHLAHGAASFMMLLTKLVLGGWLPMDPGTPWREQAPAQPEAVPEPVEEPQEPAQDLTEVKLAHGVWRCGHGAKTGVYCEHCHARIDAPSS